jgi:hypothetical protein
MEGNKQAVNRGNKMKLLFLNLIEIIFKDLFLSSQRTQCVPVTNLHRVKLCSISVAAYYGNHKKHNNAVKYVSKLGGS